MTNYNDGLWHGWNGEECPVHPKTEVEYVWNGSGGLIFQTAKAGDGVGWNTAGIYHMIAFRVIKEHREPREWWILHGKIYGYNCDQSAIHVREVIE